MFPSQMTSIELSYTSSRSTRLRIPALESSISQTRAWVSSTSKQRICWTEITSMDGFLSQVDWDRQVAPRRDPFMSGLATSIRRRHWPVATFLNTTGRNALAAEFDFTRMPIFRNRCFLPQSSQKNQTNAGLIWSLLYTVQSTSSLSQVGRCTQKLLCFVAATGQASGSCSSLGQMMVSRFSSWFGMKFFLGIRGPCHRVS
mmetsp:Transcript_5280/g.10834  ORF Transcript_5280/g.10834 Transcript_5280/m.10834 type:complete len:201 (+) Transcript_5280:291-893(+)